MEGILRLLGQDPEVSRLRTHVLTVNLKNEHILRGQPALLTYYNTYYLLFQVVGQVPDNLFTRDVCEFNQSLLMAIH